MIDECMIQELVDGLTNIFGDTVKQIILYGSVARNEATSESDIDIAIILGKALSSRDRHEFLSLASDLDTKYERVFSIIDIQQDMMDRWGDVHPFYKNIRNEGVVLWKAA